MKYSIWVAKDMKPQIFRNFTENALYFPALPARFNRKPI